MKIALSSFLLPVILICSLSRDIHAQNVSSPIEIPLVTVTYTNAANGVTYEKLGIWASLGTGSTPQLFEFDTGGAGFYAAYATNSPWWGSSDVPSSIPAFNTYGSGITYVGTQVETSFSLYTNGSASSQVFKSQGNIAVGMATNIYNIYGSSPSNELWPTNVSNLNTPPVESYFYGDFGLSLNNNGSNSILNALAQLNYSSGILPGYIVHVSPYGVTNGSYIQIGLTASDITYFASSGSVFPIAGQTTNLFFTNTTIPTCTNGQAITATMQIGTSVFSNIGVNLDTGTPTPTIHDPSSGGVPTNQYSGNSLNSGLALTLSAINTNGSASTFLSLTSGTNDGSDLVKITPDNNAFYINAGITAFYGNDVMYNLAGGTVGIMQSVPEPASLSLLGIAAGGVALACGRRIFRKNPTA